MVSYKFNGEIKKSNIKKLFGTKGQIVEFENGDKILFRDILKMKRLKYSFLKRKDWTGNSLEIYFKGEEIFKIYGYTIELRSFIKNHKLRRLTC